MAVAQGHDVVGVDSLAYSGRLKNLERLKHSAFRLVYDDICDAPAMRAAFQCFQPDAVIHLAAETHVTRSISSREEFLRTNVIGTNVLLEVALEYWQTHADKEDGLFFPTGFRFLHVSTDEVYGSLGADEEPWTEASPYAPKNPYSASKAASDHLVMAFHNTYGLPVIVTHAANNYGPRQHPEKLIPTLVRQCMRGEPMTLHGDGQQKRDWLHVDDHCAGLLAALERGKVGETYNFGGECERTNYQVATLVSHYVTNGGFGQVNYIEDRPGNDRRYLMSIAKAAHGLNWRPQRKIEEVIAETVRWYLENPNYGDDYGSTATGIGFGMLGNGQMGTVITTSSTPSNWMALR